MHETNFLIFVLLSFLLLVCAGCPMILEEEDPPWIPPEGSFNKDYHTGFTRGTGTGELGLITVTLFVKDGWIWEVFIDAPAEDPDMAWLVTEEFSYLVYQTNIVDVKPECCSSANSKTGLAIYNGVIQAAKEALNKNMAGNGWYVTPVYKTDGITLISGTAEGEFETFTIQLDTDQGFITQVTVTGGDEPVGMAAYSARMIAQNSVFVDLIPDDENASLAVREAAEKALQKLVEEP